MPTSPLAAALLSGTDANALALDPASLQATSDIQLGQQLQQAGLSSAPAYLPQALGRLGQALVGSLIRQAGTNELAKATTGGIEAAKSIFDETTPIGKGLRSESPLVRAMTFREIPTALKLNSGLVKLTPTETVTQFGGSNPVAAGSPAQAGAVAGAEARARSPYEPGGDVIIQTPNGPQQISATAATRAAIQPKVRPATLSAPPSPSAAIPMPAPKPAQSAVPASTPPTPTAAIPLTQPNATSGQTANLPGQATVPEGNAGVQMMGKPLPNAAIEPAVRADTEELSKDRERAIAGQSDMATVRAIQDFMSKVPTGLGAEAKLEAARLLKTAGVPQEMINKNILSLPDVGAGQLLQKKFVELSSAAARTMGAREPGSVIAMFSKAYPNLGTDPQAIALQTNALYMDRLRAQHLAEQKTNYLNDSINDVQGTGRYRGLKGFNEAFSKSNPAELYLHAAEAMSGAGEAWKRITTTAERNAVIRLMPPGTRYLAPDGKIHIIPGGAQ